MLAVGGDRGDPDGAELVGLVVRLDQHGRALRAGVRDAEVDVEDLQGQVDHAVAVPAVLVQQRAGPERPPPWSTNRADPESSTKDLWSRLPVSGPE